MLWKQPSASLLLVFLVVLSFPGAVETRRSSSSSSAASSSLHHHHPASSLVHRPEGTHHRRHSPLLPVRGGGLFGRRRESSSQRPAAPSTSLTVEVRNVTSSAEPSTEEQEAAERGTNKDAAAPVAVELTISSSPPKTAPTMAESKKSEAIKLLIGAGGIYGAFLYYGSLQEDVFLFESDVDGTKFTQAWFLQVLEALANIVVGFVGMSLVGPTKGIPLKMFAISGAAQVSAKACTSLALANGLSFPVATLAKSGKMAPVMAGSLLLGGATYSTREYLQVAAIIGGTAIVSMGKKGGENSFMGIFYICLSLVLDGVTAGFQKRLKTETAKAGVKPKPYDFMFWTNLFMCATAAAVALVLGQLTSGIAYCAHNPEILVKIIKFAICSAVGQSFIFYTIANFDPLVLSTITTTRKIFSVLLSIFLKGHTLSLTGWSGIALACGGIMSELQEKMGSSGAGKGKKPKKDDKHAHKN